MARAHTKRETEWREKAAQQYLGLYPGSKSGDNPLGSRDWLHYKAHYWENWRNLNGTGELRW